MEVFTWWLSIHFSQTFVVPRGWTPLMFPFSVSLGLPRSGLKWNISTTVYTLAVKFGTEVRRMNSVVFSDHLPLTWCHQKVGVFMNKHRHSWFTRLSLLHREVKVLCVKPTNQCTFLQNTDILKPCCVFYVATFCSFRSTFLLDSVVTTLCLWAG